MLFRSLYSLSWRSYQRASGTSSYYGKCLSLIHIYVKTLFGVESVKDTQSVDLVIKLEEWDRDKEYDRLGLHEEYTEYLGNCLLYTSRCV